MCACDSSAARGRKKIWRIVFMKKSLMVLLVVLAVLMAVGVAAAEDDVFRVAMVMPSKIKDRKRHV